LRWSLSNGIDKPEAAQFVGCCLRYLGLLGNVADYSGWGIKHETPQALKDIAFFHAKPRRLLGSLDQLFGKTLSLVGRGNDLTGWRLERNYYGRMTTVLVEVRK
jgi:hypothetical protein